jgi:AcrR family transcriptional regulator
VILNTALSVLTEHGYYATNMNYIAARAGVGKAAIYRRWASKAALITDALVYWRPDLLSNPLQHRQLARRPRFPCPTSQTQRRAATVSGRRTWLFERRLARANRCCAAANRSTAARPQRDCPHGPVAKRRVAHDPDHQPVQAKLLGTKAEALEQRKSATETVTEN